MQTSLFLFIIFLFFFCTSVVADDVVDSEIDYSDPNSISSARPSEINVEEAIATGNGAALTIEQWSYESNLNLADDISLYPNAQQAIENKHSGVTLSLDQGHVSYQDGRINNGEVTLDLYNRNLAGAIITAMDDGGFVIEKGSSEGSFDVEDNQINLRDENAKAEIKTNNYITLSEGATLTDAKGTKILSIGDKTTVLITEDITSVEGIALLQDAVGSSITIGDPSTSLDGSFSLDYQNNVYGIETASLAPQKSEVNTETSAIKADRIIFLDSNTLNGAAGTLRSTLASELQTICSDDQCFETASYTSLEDITKPFITKIEPYYQIAENELGLSQEVVTAVGIAGVTAAQFLPSETKFETKDGEFSAVLGYTREGFTPFIVAQYKDVEVKVEPTMTLSSSDSTVTAVASAPTSLATISTHLDMQERGTIDIAVSGQDRVSMSYKTQIGSVVGSVSVHKAGDMENVFLNIDLSRLIN
jgi:hypothetical protein